MVSFPAENAESHYVLVLHQNYVQVRKILLFFNFIQYLWNLHYLKQLHFPVTRNPLLPSSHLLWLWEHFLTRLYSNKSKLDPLCQWQCQRLLVKNFRVSFLQFHSLLIWWRRQWARWFGLSLRKSWVCFWFKSWCPRRCLVFHTSWVRNVAWAWKSKWRSFWHFACKPSWSDFRCFMPDSRPFLNWFILKYEDDVCTDLAKRSAIYGNEVLNPSTKLNQYVTLWSTALK